MLVLMFVGLLSSPAVSPAEEQDARVVVNRVEDCADGQTCVLASQLDKCSKEELYEALTQVTSALEPSTGEVEVIFEGDTADEIRASRAADLEAAAKAYAAAIALLERCPKGGTIVRVEGDALPRSESELKTNPGSLPGGAVGTAAATSVR